MVAKRSQASQLGKGAEVPALRSRLAWLFVGPLVAAILVFVPAIDVRAATPITFGTGGGLTIGNPCINGRAAVTQPIRIVWKSASGHLKARVDMTTTLGGSWTYCSDTKQLRVGDTIKAVVEGTSRTLTMPNVSIASDRSTEFHGRGPAGQDGDLWYNAGIFADYQKYAMVTTDATGHWSVQTESPLTGGIYAEVGWQTPQGDWFGTRMVTPFVKVSLDGSNTSAGGAATRSAVVKLRDPATDSLRGRAVVKFDEYGTGDGQFLDSTGAPVTARVGDRVVSNVVAGLDWHVPNVTGSADVDNDLVIGKCYATEISPMLAVVRTYRAGKARGYVFVTTDPNGTFTADFTGRPTPGRQPANIKHGDQVTIECYYETGDIVAMGFRAP